LSGGVVWLLMKNWHAWIISSSIFVASYVAIKLSPEEWDVIVMGICMLVYGNWCSIEDDLRER
jgi:hypothetical protein